MENKLDTIRLTEEEMAWVIEHTPLNYIHFTGANIMANLTPDEAGYFGYLILKGLGYNKLAFTYENVERIFMTRLDGKDIRNIVELVEEREAHPESKPGVEERFSELYTFKKEK